MSSAGLAAADRTGADVEPPAVEPGHRDLEAAAFHADQIGRRHAHALQDHLAGRLRAPSHLLLFRPESEAGRVLLDQEGGDAGRAALAGARHHQIEVARSGAGDELLDAVEHVIRPVPPGARRQRRGVGAGAGLGQAIAGDELHAGEPGQIAAFQLRRAEAVDDPGDHVVDREERRHGRATGRQRLEDQRRVEAGHAAAAMLVADVNRRHAERRGLAQDVDRKMLGLVPAKRVRRDALVGEGFRHVADGEMVCGQREHMLALPRSFPADADRATVPDLCACGNPPDDRARLDLCQT